MAEFRAKPEGKKRKKTTERQKAKGAATVQRNLQCGDQYMMPSDGRGLKTKKGNYVPTKIKT